MELEKDWSQKKILVVEDDKFIAFIIEGYLRKTKATVFVATTGEMGVEIALKEKPDLILMDIKLPGINGIDATKQIKEKLPESIVLAQTAYVTDADKQRAQEAGCTGFVPKPILRDRLLGELEKYLD